MNGEMEYLHMTDCRPGSNEHFKVKCTVGIEMEQ